MKNCARSHGPGRVRRLARGLLCGLGLSIVPVACVTTPADPTTKVKTWHPAVNDKGVTAEMAQLACREGIVRAGFESVVLLGTMVEVCMRDEGFELK